MIDHCYCRKHLGLCITASLAVLGAIVYLAGADVPASAQSFSEKAKCGVFYDKWNVPGAPQGILAMAGVGHEAAAAQDCITQNKGPTACEHYRKIIAALGKMDPAAAAQIGAGVRERMKESNCS